MITTVEQCEQELVMPFVMNLTDSIHDPMLSAATHGEWSSEKVQDCVVKVRRWSNSL